MAIYGLRGSGCISLNSIILYGYSFFRMLDILSHWDEAVIQ